MATKLLLEILSVLLAWAPVLCLAAPPSVSEDPELAELLRTAYQSSPVLAGAQARTEMAEAGVDRARAAYRPTLGASEQFRRTDDPVMAFMSILEQGRFTPEVQETLGDPATVEDWTTTLYARMLLYDAGRRRARLAAARAGAESRALLERAARRDLRYEVTARYYDLLRARAAVDLWEDTVRLFRAHEDMTRDRFEVGAVLRSDLLAIGVRRREAAEELVTARHDVEIARARLAETVGVDPSEVEVSRGEIDSPAYGATEAEVVEAARTAHPRIEALAASEEAADEALRAAKRGSLPSVSLDARAFWHGEDESFGFERDSWMAMVVVDVPIYTGGRTRAAAREAAARRDEVRAMRRQAVHALDTAARTAHRRTLEAIAREELAERAVEAAREALEIVEERYGAGMTTVVDLIEAERQLTDARVRRLQAAAAARTALAAVERVAGPEASP